MNVKKPEFSLKHPERRSELHYILKDILSLGISSSRYEIDEIYHFFFDDSSFGDSPLSEIGLSLKNSKEAAIIHALTLLLDSLLTEIGDKETAFFIKHSNWPMVTELSRLAISTIDINNP